MDSAPITMILADRSTKAKTSKSSRQKVPEATQKSQQIGRQKTYATSGKTTNQSKILIEHPFEETRQKAPSTTKNAVVIRSTAKNLTTQQSPKQASSVPKHLERAKA